MSRSVVRAGTHPSTEVRNACWPGRAQGHISTLSLSTSCFRQGWQDPSTLQREKEETLCRVLCGNESEETLELESHSLTAGSHPWVGLWLR